MYHTECYSNLQHSFLAAAIVASLSLSKRHIHHHGTKFSFSSIKEMVKFPEIIIMLMYCTASFGMILTIYPAFLNDKRNDRY